MRKSTLTRKGLALLAIALLITIGGMLGSAGYELVLSLQGDHLSYGGFAKKIGQWCLLFLLFVIVLLWAKNVVVDIMGSGAKVSVVAQEPDKEVLIMGLSNLWDDNVVSKTLQSAQHYGADVLALPKAEFDLLLGDAEKYPGLFGGSWQQNVRAIHEHRETLKKIIVLPSNKSLEQFSSFKSYVALLFGEELIVEFVCLRNDINTPYALFQSSEICRDYNEYNYVYRGLRRALVQAGLDVTLGPEDISIDVTAGTAIFSIAAAVLTLNRKIKFVYVTTDGHVLNYDAQIDLLGAAAL